jgi:tetratricopeptide (TPR) repeat protein
VLHEQVGQSQAAVEAYQAAISVAPAMAIAHYYLSQVRGRRVSDEEFAAMRKIWDEVELLPNDRMFLAFGLSRAHEHRQDFDRAFDFLSAGNRIKADMQPYDDADTARFLGSLADTAEAAIARLGPAPGCADPRPVFVLGMPRSGTSLTEQILASHSQIAGAGELSYAYDAAHRVREHTGRAFPQNLTLLSQEQWRGLGEYYLSRHRAANLEQRHVVDKTPLNFQYIGMLALALPQAKFIRCYREPVQNCFSIHRLPFDKKQAYAHDLSALGRYYRHYWTLMQRWKTLFPGRILDVRYEDMVADIEGQSRRMLDFLGVEFEPGVLEFHATTRLVKTPSAAQVRQPIYTEALDSWRNYEHRLTPLIESLQELASPGAPQARQVAVQVTP